MRAMEIPLVAFRPRPHVLLRHDRMQAFVPVLASLGLMLETVEVDRNYKINRGDTNEYLARILPDALKLHCERVLETGLRRSNGSSGFISGCRAPDRP